MGRGLIFDCDGVLVDSEVLAAAELGLLLARHGVVLPEARIYADFLGRSQDAMVARIRRDHGLDLTPHLPAYAAALADRFRRDLRAVPGMARTLGALGGPRAVASSSAPARLALSLSLTGLAERFGPHVHSAAQVARGKPAPDLFLRAAAGLGVAPADCIVIEDSPSGIAAARAAGMRVLGFLGGSHAGPAGLRAALSGLEPDGLVEHAAELPEILARMG